MKTHGLVWVKLAVLLVALGLDAYGHLDPGLVQLMTVALGALGLTGVVTAWRSAPAQLPASTTALQSSLSTIAQQIAGAYLAKSQAVDVVASGPPAIAAPVAPARPT